jgi:hypothetical protein
MPKKTAPGRAAPDPSTAFRLGFYSRHFDLDVLRQLLRTLHTTIPPNVFDELKQGVNTLKRSWGPRSNWNTPLATLVARADRVLNPSHPSRSLYDLGAALGDYALQQETAANSPAVRRVWKCVGFLPTHLTKDVGSLHELAEEAKGKRDLEAAMKRGIEPPIEPDILEDDKDREESHGATAQFWRMASELPGYLKELRTSVVVRFVAQTGEELAERRIGRKASSGQPVAKPDGKAEVFVPTPLQESILSALDGTALQTKALAKACNCDEPRLFKKGGIKELQDLRIVLHKDGIGYFRPDRPPPNAILIAGNNPPVIRQ